MIFIFIFFETAETAEARMFLCSELVGENMVQVHEQQKPEDYVQDQCDDGCCDCIFVEKLGDC